VEILKSIHHPNIVKLLDVYNSETCVYLVMELVTGGHLQARLKDNARVRVGLRVRVRVRVRVRARVRVPVRVRVRVRVKVRVLTLILTGGHLQARLKDNGCYNEDQAKLLLGQVRHLVITPGCSSR